MKKFLAISVVVLLVLGCEPNLKPKKPDNLIPKEKMTNLLYDMFITSSAKGINRPKFEKLGLNPETYILKKYSIDSLQFAESNNYYAYDIKIYKSMIEDVKRKISAEKEKYVAIDKEEQKEKDRKKDSLKKLLQRLKVNPNLEVIKPKKKKKKTLSREVCK
ncbi:MAG: DUF4296 domain-containing protein [Winogradskyella sp.]|uniref:DUF4296 domain-containing protein n=1 Tax=Winogradskyella sp. TaxID=1883156 RepID=UPI00184E90FF|nr:DUF4296 domain-containing protein [Winogradskyella sp.]MBT8244002.1 DUF4296 domain-containing protein [Winogradskyella sp.]NNK23807.1 DUF4296 domain-containing protein [Winogradskyella sp.]